MRRIATAIEYTLPVIYTHFKSKEEIISTLANQGFRLLKERLDNLINQQYKSDRILFQTLAFEYYKFAQEEKALYAAMYGLEGVSSFAEDTPHQGEELFNYVEQKLAEFKKNGAKIGNTWHSTKLIWSTLHGLITLDWLGRITDKTTTVDVLIENYIDLLLNTWEVK